MSSRVQVILSQEDLEAFRQEAAARQRSLSNWLRQAGLKELQARRSRPIRTPDDLREFFASLPQEAGTEPDWRNHLQVIDASRHRGATAT